jgi:hypothetical protein
MHPNRSLCRVCHLYTPLTSWALPSRFPTPSIEVHPVFEIDRPDAVNSFDSITFNKRHESIDQYTSPLYRTHLTVTPSPWTSQQQALHSLTMQRHGRSNIYHLSQQGEHRHSSRRRPPRANSVEQRGHRLSIDGRDHMSGRMVAGPLCESG